MEEGVPLQEGTGATVSEELHVSLPPRLSELRTLANRVEAFGYTHQIPETKIFIVIT